MPDNPPTFLRGRDDVALVDALTTLRVVMDTLVNEEPSLLSLEVREQSREVWPEVREQLDFLVEMIRAPEPVAGVASTTMYLNAAYQGALVNVGLTGNALALKVGGIKRAFARWLSGVGGVVRRHAHSFFRWTDTMLGSLAEALGPLAEFVKEFKECLENDLEDREDEEVTPAAVRR